jgi:hypothetical protein
VEIEPSRAENAATKSKCNIVVAHALPVPANSPSPAPPSPKSKAYTESGPKNRTQRKKNACIVSSYRKLQISNSSKYTQISVLTDPIEVMFYKNTVISRGTSKAATKESEALHAAQKIIPPGTNPKITTGSSLPDQFVAFI